MTDEELQEVADELGEPLEIVRSVYEAMMCCEDEERLERENP